MREYNKDTGSIIDKNAIELAKVMDKDVTDQDTAMYKVDKLLNKPLIKKLLFG